MEFATASPALVGVNAPANYNNNLGKFEKQSRKLQAYRVAVFYFEKLRAGNTQSVAA